MENFSKESRAQKCLIYCRVSSRKQEREGSGLSGQERSCRDYAKSKGYRVVQVIDDVFSGAYSDRPGIKRLEQFLTRVNPKEYVVIVYDISRFARDIVAHRAVRNLMVQRAQA
ncbi:recombinase family protein [Leisingera aquaemixtae]|uniref:recombinase family protein n=1 Tax=Leisingera aquaemixtae TaxID=1396826 RepID=UPI002207EF3B|nr:recombinase family protein [Leisingera aquaemixtae]